ncbi:sensor domain-containing protein, partial [Actinotalea sp. C106]|uniref:sensor domain-containing protein n=1 Tax=Actinotalea sp. C106 TaxID=2908644 RepID=UPI0020296503
MNLTTRSGAESAASAGSPSEETRPEASSSETAPVEATAPSSAVTLAPTRGPLSRLGRDTGYVLGGLPITLVSFTVLVTGLCLAAGLLITVIGVPVAAGTLATAVGFGRLERLRLAARGTALAPVQYAPRR